MSAEKITPPSDDDRDKQDWGKRSQSNEPWKRNAQHITDPEPGGYAKAGLGEVKRHQHPLTNKKPAAPADSNATDRFEVALGCSLTD